MTFEPPAAFPSAFMPAKSSPSGVQTSAYLSLSTTVVPSEYLSGPGVANVMTTLLMPAKAAADATLADIEARYQAIVEAQQALDDAQAALDAAIAAELEATNDKNARDAANTAADVKVISKEAAMNAANDELSPVLAIYTQTKAALDAAQKELDDAKAEHDSFVVTDLVITVNDITYTVGEPFDGKILVSAQHKDGSVTRVADDDEEMTVTAPEIPTSLTAEEVTILANGGKVTRPFTVEYPD